MNLVVLIKLNLNFAKNNEKVVIFSDGVSRITSQLSFG